MKTSFLAYVSYTVHNCNATPSAPAPTFVDTLLFSDNQKHLVDDIKDFPQIIFWGADIVSVDKIIKLQVCHWNRVNKVLFCYESGLQVRATREMKPIHLHASAISKSSV